MFCKFCGVAMKEGANFCTKCGNNLVETTVETKDFEISENIKKENKEATIYIAVFLMGILAMLRLEKFGGIGFIVSLISIVTGFIRCRTNWAIKVLFWLFFGAIISYVILIIVLIIACASALSNCASMG